MRVPFLSARSRVPRSPARATLEPRRPSSRRPDRSVTLLGSAPRPVRRRNCEAPGRRWRRLLRPTRGSPRSTPASGRRGPVAPGPRRSLRPCYLLEVGALRSRRVLQDNPAHPVAVKLAELQRGEGTQRVSEQDVHPFAGFEHLCCRIVHVFSEVLDPLAAAYPRARTVPAQVDGDHAPPVLREPRPDPPPGARRGRNPVHEHGERVALLAQAIESQPQNRSTEGRRSSSSVQAVGSWEYNRQ